MNKIIKRVGRAIRSYFTLHVETMTLREKTIKRLHFNFEYVLLLITSVVISTLGLLMDSSVIVIGGMLVSPLIIPILSLSLGIYDGNIRVMHKALIMIVVSVMVTIGVTMLITELSPLKNMTNEIIGLTKPTLLDLFIALAAGLIGIMATSHRKIADSFAGVAIATSLVPPLSVAGIGISFGESSLFYGGMLLFLLNLLAITFIGTVYLTVQHWLAKDKTHISVKALSVIGVSLLLLMLPLTLQLRSYTRNISLQKGARESIERTLAEQHPQSRIDHIDTNIEEKGGETVAIITTDLTINETDTISYQLQKQMTEELEERLDTNVQLKLNIQRSVGVVSEEQDKLARATKEFSAAFSDALKKRYPDVTIERISLDYPKNKTTLLATIHLAGAPTDEPSKRSLEEIQAIVSNSLPTHAEYAITYSPVITLTP
ncbi:MAG: DUF389 domain-containing protein [Candidatus Saccharimonadales bacterium]